MTRKLIAIEGIRSAIPNTWLAKGSLRMEADRIPVTVSFDNSNLVGWAQDLQRDEETGKVTVDVSLFEQFDWGENNMDEETYDYTFYATQVVSEQVEATDEIPAHRLVTEANLRGITIVPIDALRVSSSRNSHGS